MERVIGRVKPLDLPVDVTTVTDNSTISQVKLVKLRGVDRDGYWDK